MVEGAKIVGKQLGGLGAGRAVGGAGMKRSGSCPPHHRLSSHYISA